MENYKKVANRTKKRDETNYIRHDESKNYVTFVSKIITHKIRRDVTALTVWYNCTYHSVGSRPLGVRSLYSEVVLFQDT